MTRTASPIRWIFALLFLATLTACPTEPVRPSGSENLQQLQGLWEARWGIWLIRREIVGAKEVVSYYGSDGLLARSHQADIEATTSPDGRYLIFRWYNLRPITGPAVSPQATQGQYLYTIEGSKFTEYHGTSLEKPETTEDPILWIRLSGGSAPAGQSTLP